jgi:hypothetical protein
MGIIASSKDAAQNVREDDSEWNGCSDESRLANLVRLICSRDSRFSAESGGQMGVVRCDFDSDWAREIIAAHPFGQLLPKWFRVKRVQLAFEIEDTGDAEEPCPDAS